MGRAAVEQAALDGASRHAGPPSGPLFQAGAPHARPAPQHVIHRSHIRLAATVSVAYHARSCSTQDAPEDGGCERAGRGLRACRAGWALLQDHALHKTPPRTGAASVRGEGCERVGRAGLFSYARISVSVVYHAGSYLA